MKRRLTIARSLVNEPEVILLDEPTTGLDPQARHVVWDRLYRLKRQGVTLLLTTHYMDEAEQLCDRLVVMDKGKIVAEGSPRQLIERYSTREVVELRLGDDEGRPRDFAELTDGLVSRVEPLPDRVLLYTDDGDAAAHGLHERGLVPESVLVRRSTLEDVFLHLTGRTSSSNLASGHMSTYALAVRPLEFFFAQYRRVWRGTVVSTVVTPIIYLLAFGYGLGTLVDRSSNLPEGDHVPRLRGSGPAGRDGDADRVLRGELAGPLRDQVEPSVPRDAGDTAPDPRHRARAPGVHRVSHVRHRDGLPDRDRGVRGRRVAARDPRDPGDRARRPRLLGSDRGVGRVHGDRRLVRRDLPLRDPARCSCSRARSSRSSSFPGVLQVVAYAMPLSHGVALCRQLTLGDVEPSALAHLAYLLAFTAAGLAAAFWSYRRRLLV